MESGPSTPIGASIGSSSSNAKSKSKDMAWQYGIPHATKKDCVQCTFCNKVTNGGKTRFKQHLAGGFRNAAACPKCPPHIKDMLKEQFQKKKADKDALSQMMQYDALTEDDYDDDIASSISGPRGVPGPKGPIDMFFRKVPDAKRKKGNEEESQQKYYKELRDRAVQLFARWMYDAGIAFNPVKYESLQHAIDAIAQHGPGMKAPSYHEVRVTMLQKEKEHTEKLVEENMEEARKHGCSLMADGWTDSNGRTLVNFLVNTPKGSVFLDSVDASSYSKTAERMVELLSKYIEKVGPQNIVQVVTDNASENVKAGRMLEGKYPHLYWTPCAAHCLDLVLEDIFKIPKMKSTIERAIKVNGYIYARPLLLNMMRKFTKQKEMVRPAKTRFATAFLTLKRFHEQKKSLMELVDSQEYHESRFSKEDGGKKIRRILLLPQFWKNIHYALKIGCPLVNVLRMVDGEKKPAMGFIYEAMDRAKGVIASSFNGDESKYNDIFAVIDKRWETQLHRPLHAAGYYLNPALFYSNQDVHQDESIIDGLTSCIEKMATTREERLLITKELNAYRNVEGSFGKSIAIEHRSALPPAEWWLNYGAITPHLQKFAVRILSLVCSSSGCKRNWSFFEHIHNKKRNRLAQQRLNDLVYIKYNRALKRRFKLREHIDPIILEDIDECNEWLTGIPEAIKPSDEHDDLSWLDATNIPSVGEEQPNYNLRSSESQQKFPSNHPQNHPQKRKRPFILVDEPEDESDGPLLDLAENAQLDGVVEDPTEDDPDMYQSGNEIEDDGNLSP